MAALTAMLPPEKGSCSLTDQASHPSGERQTREAGEYLQHRSRGGNPREKPTSEMLEEQTMLEGKDDHWPWLWHYPGIQAVEEGADTWWKQEGGRRRGRGSGNRGRELPCPTARASAALEGPQEASCHARFMQLQSLAQC